MLYIGAEHAVLENFAFNLENCTDFANFTDSNQKFPGVAEVPGGVLINKKNFPEGGSVPKLPDRSGLDKKGPQQRRNFFKKIN